ncbi:hypothetical protein BD410DRAFT_817284 [Rickenella mellea]|uniref:NYN domain-containing protein n=1 Tax=Rickenella mellea TaxID=50990 RepID=A0A4Y7PEA0_9AGAM|nr:hypothetical protein BD410DRAFT_817284 [Rickenella mellea]
METNGHVAVFWDYENCRPPSSASGYDVVTKIRRAVRAYGSITYFKAYLDVPLETTNPRSLNLHSGLQASGGTLAYCPHSGKKDVADKTMLVDMIAYAIDRPAPATIVLISGDRDFAYGISTLRLRGYDVVVIVPPSAHSSVRSQATFTGQRHYHPSHHQDI